MIPTAIQTKLNELDELGFTYTAHLGARGRLMFVVIRSKCGQYETTLDWALYHSTESRWFVADICYFVKSVSEAQAVT